METMTENIVTTLKAEKINEFEFIPREERVNRFSQETTIIHPYKSDYKAKVAVKVGNKKLLMLKNVKN